MPLTSIDICKSLDYSMHGPDHCLSVVSGLLIVGVEIAFKRHLFPLVCRLFPLRLLLLMVVVTGPTV